MRVWPGCALQILSAYGSYIVAEAVHLSGIMSLLFAVRPIAIVRMFSLRLTVVLLATFVLRP